MTCPRLHWATDNPSGMHRCQFQYLCVLILNCALALAIYIFVGLILMLWHKETHINPQRNIHTYIHTCMFVVVNFDALAQASDIRIERRQVVFLCLLNVGFEPNISDTYSPADWMPADKPTELSRIKLKNYTYIHACVCMCVCLCLCVARCGQW